METLQTVVVAVGRWLDPNQLLCILYRLHNNRGDDKHTDKKGYYT